MKTLKKEVDSISFFEREKSNGKYVLNKCGRDFLYYALNYYYPALFNSTSNNPLDIDAKKRFGQPVPAWLAWTGIQFLRVPEFLQKHELALLINDREIKSYLDFALAILFSRKEYSSGIDEIEDAVDHDVVCAVDISIGGPLGLIDHVIFVYGYDEESLYVIDSRKVRFLNYENNSGNKFLFKFSKMEIKAQWTRFGRVWKVVQTV